MMEQVFSSLQHERQKGETLLEGVAEAARRLLAIADFDAAVNGALEAIATAAGIDRIYIDEFHVDVATSHETMTCPYEWTVSGVVKCREIPGRFPMAMESFGDWSGKLKAGQSVQGLARHLSKPAKDLQDLDKALSLLAVPILINGRLWGCIGFDDCTSERVWSEAEIAVLETAAASFAGALQRRDDVAELERRDALLKSVNAAAQCLVAEDDLTQAIPEALRILGEGTQQDRVYLFENIPNLETHEILWDMPFEWNAPGIPSSTEYGMHLPIPMSAFPPQIIEPFFKGKPFHCLVRDLEGTAFDLNEDAQALSLIGVPIAVEGRIWGVLGFDDCRAERIWSDAEIAVLETAAASIGSAIERDRTRQEREAAIQARAIELEAHNQVLEGRDRILKAIAEAANVLLTDGSLDAAVKTALEIIGVAVKTDRVAIIQDLEAPSGNAFGLWRLIYEWTSPETLPVSQTDHPEHVQGTYEGIEDIRELHCKGEGFSRMIDEFPDPFRSGQKELGVQAMHSIPIMLNGSYWGAVTFDDCHMARRRSDADLAVLQMLADCLGSAIERDRNRKEKEAAAEARVAELAERDRILEATAAAANVMLTDNDFNSAVNTALKIVGEGLAVDRINLGQYFTAPAQNEFNYYYFLYEWTSAGTPVQIEHPEHVKVSEEGIESLTEAMHRGDVFGGIVEELPEPFRSTQLELGVKSTYAVSIMVDDRFWGIVGFDDCHRLTQRSEAELEALKTLANCIGNAIARDRTRQEKEAATKARVAELAKRDRILEATAAAANIMLTDDDFDGAVNIALEIVGNGLEVDRILLGQYLDATFPPEQSYIEFLYEWISPGTSLQTEHPELVRVSGEGIECIFEALQRGETFGGVIHDLPEPFRSGQIELGVQSTYSVPVMVGGEFWGVISFDDCHQLTHRSEAELEALKTLANCIGNAIDRDRSRKEREAATQAYTAQLQKSNEILLLRERWLNATAAAAEELLAIDDLDYAINNALRILGEGVDVDRTVVTQLIEDPTGQTSGCARILYEWDSPFATSVMATGQVDIPNAGLEECLPQLLAGDWMGGTIDDLNEPFKSVQVALGVQSVYIVPILLGKKLWGAVSVDHCREKRRLSETEIAVFQTAASCIGSAIQRDKIHHAREAAERKALIERERAVRADELEAANQVLRTRDRWLKTTAIVAHQLLSKDEEEASVNQALRTIGENLECDRVYVMRPMGDFDPTAVDLGVAKVVYEWTAKGIRPHIDDPTISIVPGDQFKKSAQRLLAGEWVGGVVEELEEPLRSRQQAIGNQSVYVVPVFTDGQYWGVVGIDHCREAKRLNAAELALFKTAATCIGSAIYQAEVRRDRTAQERAKLLGRVAEAANLLLRSPDYTTVLPEVVRLLGEAVECNRCSIVQGVAHENVDNAAIKVLTEWQSAEIPHTNAAVSTVLEAGEIVLEEELLLFQQPLLRGEVLNFLVADLPNPVRLFFESQGNTSMLLVPIMVQGQRWGEIGFDNCGEPRLYDEAEISILRVAAESIAAAIARQAQDEALRESEQRFRELLEASNDSIHFVEFAPPLPLNLPMEEQIDRIYSTCRFVEINPAYERDLGMSRPEIIGKPLSIMHSPNDVGHRALMRQLIENNWQITNAESEDIGPDGNKRYWLSHLFTTEDNGCIVRAWGVVNNITSLKQAQLDRERAERAILEEREKAARDRAAELAKTNEAIGQALVALTTAPELGEFLGQILTQMANQVEACKAHLFLYDAATNTLNQYMAVRDGQAYLGAGPSDPDMFRHPIPADLSRAWEIIVNSPKPFTLDERHPEAAEAYWPESVPWHQAEGHLSSTCACMKVGGQPIGFIGFAFRHLPTLSDEQLEFIQALTNQATLSIHLTRLAEEAKQTAILQEQEKAAQERAAELAKTNEAIAKSLTNLAASPELDQFLGTIIAEMARQLRACKVHLFLYDPPTHTLTQRVAVQDGQIYVGTAPDDPEMFSHPIPADLTPGWETIITSERPLVYDDTQPYEEELWWPESLMWHKAQGHKAITCIPMKAGDIPIGYIGFCFYDRTFLSNEQLEFMQALANQAIVAIQLTTLAEEAKQTAVLAAQEKAAQERAAQLMRSNQALKRSLDSLAQQPELEAFLQRVVNEAAAQTAAANGHLFLFDDATQTLTLRVATENNGNWREIPDMELWKQPVPVDAAPSIWEMMLTKKPFFDEDFQSRLQPGPHLWEPSITWHQQRGHTRIICAPLVLGGQVLGILGLSFIGETTFTPDEVELTQALANQATLALQLTRLADKAKQAALLKAQEKAAQARAAELANTNEAISKALNILTTTPDLDEFLGQILTCIIERIGADDTHLFLYDEESHTLRAHLVVQGDLIYSGAAPGDPDIFHHPVPADITAAWNIIVNSSKPFTLDENNPESIALLWPGTEAWHQSRGHQSATCTCMKIGAQPIGFIGFAFCDRTILTEEQLEFIQALTNQATLAIHLTQLAEKNRNMALLDERNRLAREIHDTLAQAFTGVSLQLEVVRSLTHQPTSTTSALEKAQPYIRRARDLARQGLSEARRSVRALRSQALETDDLPSALCKLLSQTQRDTGLTTHLHLNGTPPALTDDLQLNLLRIAQEAITNTLRHASATQLDLTLSFYADHAGEQVQLQITDNGIGFDPATLIEQNGFGLVGIRERAVRFYGSFDLQSTPANGTTLQISIPLRGDRSILEIDEGNEHD